MDFRDVKGNKVGVPKDFYQRPSVYGVLIEDKKIIFIQPSWDNKYCLPGGSIDLGESPIEALEREFLEETGYEVKSDAQPIFVDNHFYGDPESGKYFQRISMYYNVRRISKKQNKNIDKESVEIFWKNLRDLNSDDFTFFQRDFLKSILNR